MRELGFALFIVGFAAAIPASATTFYCSTCSPDTPAQFTTDTNSFTMTPITFSGAVDPTTGYTFDGVNFTDFFGTNSNLTIVGGNLVDTRSSSPGIAISLPSTVVGFSFDIQGNNGSSASVAFYDNGGTTFESKSLSMTGSPVFLGAISDSAPITNFQILGGTPSITISNFEIFEAGGSSGGTGGTDPTPEPASFYMFCAGFLGLSILRFRRWAACESKV